MKKIKGFKVVAIIQIYYMMKEDTAGITDFDGGGKNMRKYSLRVSLAAVCLALFISGCQDYDTDAERGKENLGDGKGQTEEIRKADSDLEGESGYIFVEEEELSDGADVRAEVQQPEVIAARQEKEPDSLKNMVLYSSCPFMYEEKEWELQAFVQEDMLIKGELAMDDRCRFAIQVICGQDSYLLFDETVQLGMPEADVWTDEQEKLHIMLRDVRTAKYRVTDFIYHSEKGEFLGSYVVDGEGINYLGTTEK